MDVIVTRTKSLAAQVVVNWGVEYFKFQRASVQTIDSLYRPSIQREGEGFVETREKEVYGLCPLAM